MNRLSCVLLTGGESRRMGRDKATLVYKGQPLWRHSLEILRDLRSAEILVSARTDPAWRPPDAVFVADRAPSRGPLSGLAAALDLITGTHLLALAVDMPFMTAAYLQSLWQMAEPGCGVVPVIGGRVEPLAAIYPLDAVVHFREALNGSDYSLQRIVRRLVDAKMLRSAVGLPGEEEHFYNLNERADLLDPL